MLSDQYRRKRVMLLLLHAVRESDNVEAEGEVEWPVVPELGSALCLIDDDEVAVRSVDHLMYIGKPAARVWFHVDEEMFSSLCELPGWKRMPEKAAAD